MGTTGTGAAVGACAIPLLFAAGAALVGDAGCAAAKVPPAFCEGFAAAVLVEQPTAKPIRAKPSTAIRAKTIERFVILCILDIVTFSPAFLYTENLATSWLCALVHRPAIGY
jgi:hypothetical protein